MPMDMRYVAWNGWDLAECDTTTSGIGGYGTIQIEYSWQLVAVPITHGYWSIATHKHVHNDSTIAKYENYIQAQIDDLYGPGKIEVANTYLGDNQFFWSYVPGSTPISSPHNFNLVYEDSGYQEISGFWIKSLSVSPIIVTWGDQP
jgi:hypothetical protein